MWSDVLLFNKLVLNMVIIGSAVMAVCCYSTFVVCHNSSVEYSKFMANLDGKLLCLCEHSSP